MTIDVNSIESNELYNLMIGSVLPRPIAWVGSTSEEGIDNLAAFSFFLLQVLILQYYPFQF